MRKRLAFVSMLSLFALLGCAHQSSSVGRSEVAQQGSPPADVPYMWDDAAMRQLEVPLSHRDFAPRHLPAEYYYRMPVRPVYRSYPVYAPGREPAGYFESLQQKDPEEIKIDRAHVTTDRDWVRFGEIIFQAPVTYDCCVMKLEDVRTPAWYQRTGAPVAADGTLPYVSYVIRKRGNVELGTFSCGFCHSRVMDNGSVIRGAQGNLPFDRIWAYQMRTRDTADILYGAHLGLFGKPWDRDAGAPYRGLTVDQFAALHEVIPPGALARHRTSPFDPVQVPDLIGVKDRRYLDRTGLQRHDSIVDLMRYGALNQGGDDLASFGGFIPFGENNRELPPADSGSRYSDDHLYALARYLYSLTPPPNPNKPTTLSAEGKRVFDRERCASCHTPPLYTNNQLLPVREFTVPAADREHFHVSSRSIDTDPRLTMDTRRGTGYYKVPSLLGVWYRGPFHHSGAIPTLEAWFDSARLQNDFQPLGGGPRRPVRGHEFGLALTPAEKRALIAYLKTL